MKQTIGIVLSMCVAVLKFQSAPAAEPAGDRAAPRPNIVFILADDLGINDLACYGRIEHRTPNLDGLAASGLRFSSAYCASPICSPSRAAILTGKHPARLHLTTYLPGRSDCAAQELLQPMIRQELPLEEKTLAEYLKAAGYATACIGKWHLGGRGFGPREQGFHVYHRGRAVTVPSEVEGGKGEYDLTAAAEEFITTHREEPFFLYLAHHSPHIPYSAKANIVARNRHAFEPVYAAVIETLDDTVGRLLARIDELGLATNTIVIFTSDNGGLHVPEMGHKTITHNTPFRAGKGFLYEGGTRVPLIVRWPGHAPAGRVIWRPVTNTDWLPTLLEAAGVPVPDDLDGVSILPLITGRKGALAARSFFWHFPHYSNQGGRPAGAVRAGEWKLIQSYEDNSIELFNLRRDPRERRNLAEREPERAKQLLAELEAWREQVSAQTNRLNPQFDAAQHEELYSNVDVSQFNPSTADQALKTRVLRWRRLMDAAVARDRRGE